MKLYPFLLREWRLYGARIPYFLFSDGVVRALLFGTVFGYLIPAIGMPHGTWPRGVSYVGTMIFSLFPMVAGMCQELLMDYESDRHCDYLISQSSVATVYSAKVFFSTGVLWLLSAAYCMVSKYILGDWFEMSNMSLISLILTLGASAFAITTLMLLCYASMTRTTQVRMLWRRILVPLTFLSGYLVPWAVVYEVSPILAQCMYINPMVYILEGLRSAFFNLPIFFPVWLCIGVLLIFGTMYWYAGIMVWRRKLDAL